MRIIKFRVWDVLTKTFVSEKDFNLITIRFDGLPQYFSGDNVSIHGKFWPEHLVLQQFTGVLDKNGKEIYEGDILEYSFKYAGSNELHRYIEKVCWEHDGFRLVTLDGKSSNQLAGANNLCTIIGNIFEDNELLKK